MNIHTYNKPIKNITYIDNIPISLLGADPNAQDASGRTPLHAAIAADAVGVFQILLTNKNTKTNVRTLDGTTPLILAVRIAVEDMVGELLHADVDINGADDNGKAFGFCSITCNCLNCLTNIAFTTPFSQ